LDLRHHGDVLVAFTLDEMDFLLEHLHLDQVFGLREQQIKGILDWDHTAIVQHKRVQDVYGVAGEESWRLVVKEFYNFL
jgi:hypothetical protein